LTLIELEKSRLSKLKLIESLDTADTESDLMTSIMESIAQAENKSRSDNINKNRSEKRSVGIYDTRGFELGRKLQAEVKQEVIDTISKGLATQDINKAIHCIWYCINTASNRVEPEESEWLKLDGIFKYYILWHGADCAYDYYGKNEIEHKTLFFTAIQKNPGTENDYIEILK